MNESVAPQWKDQVGWVVAHIDGADRSAQVSKAIDELFSERDIQTISMSENALGNSFMGMFSAMLRAMDLISIVILAIILLILGNTVAMGVRERTHEFGVLRAIGFLPWHLCTFVLTEAAVIGALGGTLGLALSYPIVEQGIGRFLEDNMQGMFPYFRIAPRTALVAFFSAAALGLLAAAIPSYNASKLRVVDALRRVG